MVSATEVSVQRPLSASHIRLPDKNTPGGDRSGSRHDSVYTSLIRHAQQRRGIPVQSHIQIHFASNMRIHGASLIFAFGIARRRQYEECLHRGQGCPPIFEMPESFRFCGELTSKVAAAWTSTTLSPLGVMLFIC